MMIVWIMVYLMVCSNWLKDKIFAAEGLVDCRVAVRYAFKTFGWWYV